MDFDGDEGSEAREERDRGREQASTNLRRWDLRSLPLWPCPIPRAGQKTVTFSDPLCLFCSFLILNFDSVLLALLGLFDAVQLLSST